MMGDFEVVKYDVADTAIQALAEKSAGLKIEGIEDRAGYAAVHAARMEFKGLRVKVEKRRKELKADALEWGRRVDTEAARLTGLMEPHENRLLAEEKRIDDEKARIAAAEEARKQAVIQARRNALFQIGARFDGSIFTLPDINVTIPEAMIIGQSEAIFNASFNQIKGKMEARRLEIEAQKREEQEKLDAQRREIEAEKKRQEEARAAHEIEMQKIRDAQRLNDEKMKAERDAIEREKAAIQAEKDAIAREERRKVEAIEKEKAEAARIEAEKKAAAERAARIEATKPDFEKLRSWVDALNTWILDHPCQINTKEGDAIYTATLKQIGNALTYLKSECRGEDV